MSDRDTLTHDLGGLQGLDFTSLREEAIKLAQQLSGKIWTDYNLHDPGVTILEHLCFGMSELAYQADISVPEYLSDQHGVINYHQYSLFKPHEILPNTALTIRDYCKLLIDAIPEVDAVYLEPVGRGIYNIQLKLRRLLTTANYSAQQQRQLAAQARALYLRNRNLGEDINEIIIEQTQPCFLRFRIETTGRRPHADIAADIFFQCVRAISSDIRIQRYEEAYTEHGDLSFLFDGPLTHRGYIPEHNINEKSNVKPLQELNSLVAAISGVKKIYQLELVDAKGVTISEAAAMQHGFHLQLPETPAQMNFIQVGNHITQLQGGGPSDSTAATMSKEKGKKLLSDMKRYLQHLEFEYKAFRTNKSQAASFYPMPKGVERLPLNYFSIQNLFPNNYGINAAGVRAFESEERKIQARQLKTYLYPLEQLMGNFLQQIQELQYLFNIHDGRPYSYFSQYLEDQHIPDIEALYENNSPAQVHLIQEKYDNFSDRKNRVLNSLLAIYGEVFPEEQLRHFDDYHQGSTDYWMIDNKINYLKHLVELSCARARGFDQSIEHWLSPNISLTHKKINILLGLPQIEATRSFAAATQQLNIQLVADDEVIAKTSTRRLAELEVGYLPMLHDKQDVALKKWSYQPDKKITLSNSMVRAGVYLDNYRVLQTAESVDIYFLLPQQQQLVLLKRTRQLSEAITYTHKFKKIITQFNSQSEGFHLIEHLLLRPRMQPGQPQPEASDDACDVEASDEHFFDFRLSLIFPAWTTRCSNPAFRLYVRQLLNENFPAHLLTQIYWLDYADMAVFERQYQDWLAALGEYQQAQLHPAGDIDPSALNKRAQQLADWLKEHMQLQEYWM